VVVLALLLLTACSVKPKSREDDTTTDFRHIASAYDIVQSGKNRPPKDIDELRKVLTELHDAKLMPAPDDVLISSRDGLPYVIVFGLSLGAQVSHDIFIYEQRGFDGQRYVMTMSRNVQQLSEDGFRGATFAKGHRPAPPSS